MQITTKNCSLKRANEIDKIVGTHLRQFRLRRGISQEKIARELGISFQQVQKYEKGTNRISAGKLYILAELFQVSVTDFYDSDVEIAPLPKLNQRVVNLIAGITDKNKIRFLLTTVLFLSKD